MGLMVGVQAEVFRVLAHRFVHEQHDARMGPNAHPDLKDNRISVSAIELEHSIHARLFSAATYKGRIKGDERRVFSVQGRCEQHFRLTKKQGPGASIMPPLCLVADYCKPIFQIAGGQIQFGCLHYLEGQRNLVSVLITYNPYKPYSSPSYPRLYPLLKSP